MRMGVEMEKGRGKVKRVSQLRRPTDRQEDRQTERQTDRQTDRQADRQTEK